MSRCTNNRWVTSAGNNLQHRDHYVNESRVSITNKWRLKCVIFIHILLLLIMLVRLSVGLFVLCNIRPPGVLQRLRLPRAWIWEYAWLLSFIVPLLGILSIMRNGVILIRLYMISTFLFGMLPALYAVIDLFDDLISYWHTRESKQLFHGYPIVVLWNMFLAVCLQTHGFGIYFAWCLLKTWKLQLVRRKKT